MLLEDPTVGFKWPVSVGRSIPAPAPIVWAAISRPQKLELCHPFCAANPIHVWPGPESHDEVHYLSGWVYERQFRKWFEGVGYDLDIGRSGGGKSLVSWRIVPIDDHSSTLRIAVCPHALQNLPVGIRWFPYAMWLRPLLRKYLDSVVRGFEWYIVRHEAVPKNAFGTHPWFSAREPVTR